MSKQHLPTQRRARKAVAKQATAPPTPKPARTRKGNRARSLYRFLAERPGKTIHGQELAIELYAEECEQDGIEAVGKRLMSTLGHMAQQNADGGQLVWPGFRRLHRGMYAVVPTNGSAPVAEPVVEPELEPVTIEVPLDLPEPIGWTKNGDLVVRFPDGELDVFTREA